MKLYALIVATFLIFAANSFAEVREPGKMAIVSAKAQPDGLINVTTTGASFDFDPAKSEVRVTALLAEGKPTATLKLDHSMQGLKLLDQDRDLCHLQAPGLALEVDFGSILKLQSADGLVLTSNGKEHVSIRSFDAVPQRPGAFTRWYACVQPARKFDYDAYFNDRVVHIADADEKVYSTDENIRKARDFYGANILLIWMRIWKGQYEFGTFQATDDEALKRNIATAHALGMKAVLYTQEYPGGRGEDGLAGFIKRMPRAKEVYGADGLYFDGLAAVGTSGKDATTSGWENNLILLREARRLFRDGIIIQHIDGEETSVFADHMHYGEHIGSLEQVKQTLYGRPAKGWAIGNLIENANGVDEPFVDGLLDNDAAMRFGLWYVYGDEGFGPGTGMGWDVRFLRLYRDYYLPKLGLKQLKYKLATGSALTAADEQHKAELTAQLEKYDQWKRDIAAAQIPLGYTPKAVTASSVLDPRYNTWLCRAPLAADGSVLSIWVGGKAALGTGLARKGGTPEAGVTDWLQVDYGQPVQISRIVYDNTYPDHEKDIWQESFTVSASVDGKNWTPVLTQQGLKASRRFEVKLDAPVTAQFLKVHNILSHFEGYPKWRLAYVTDLQAYGGPGGSTAK